MRWALATLLLAGCDEWHHLVLIWHPNLMNVWIDGIDMMKTQQSTLAFDGSPMVIGADINDHIADGRLSGSLDDVRIYNRELSGDEVIALSKM